MALSFLLSFIHALILILLPVFTFLWIIGKLKALREQNEFSNTQQLVQHPIVQPSPSNEHLQPRRLSFSSVLTTPTTMTPKRRVTFSLTPEQQANELLKTAVRRREALPSTNHVIQNHSFQYNQPLQQVAHLFPSPIHSSTYNPSNPTRKSPVNNFQNTFSNRYPTQRKPLPRPTSPPPYAVNLIPSSRTPPKQNIHNGFIPQRPPFQQSLDFQRKDEGIFQRSVR